MILYVVNKGLVVGFTIVAVIGVYCRDMDLVTSGVLFAILFQLAAMEEKL